MEVRKFFITPEASIREAISQLDQTAKKLLVVVENNKLIGIITDGDIRRWILKNGDITKPIHLIMNTSPVYLKEEERGRALDIMRHRSVEGIPLLNEHHEVVEILFWTDTNDRQKVINSEQKVPVVIMAGGKGTRLYPYTNVIPKPLIPVGDIPIVERIMNQFITYGFEEFYLTMNYKKDMIKAYFSGEPPYNLTFLEEVAPFGTAASLKLVEDRINGSFFVSNCDILLDLNFNKLLHFHKENKNRITLVTALKCYEIPYGVVNLGENGVITLLKEKPKLEFLVNTGLYVLESEILRYIPSEKTYDMTDLIQDCLNMKEKVGAYPVMESTWLDMGGWKELQHMEERLSL
jgi:dTDP-glucose pyrophosphorylase